MLLRIAYCDDEIENGKKIRDYINQLMIQIEVEFELDFMYLELYYWKM